MTATPPAPDSAPTAHALPQPASLRAVAQNAAVQGEPLVVMTTLKGCPYCDLVRNSYLLPMRAKGQVHAVQIDTRDDRTPLQGFQGESTTSAALARAWKARFAPTVMFLDVNGREIAERLVGVAVPDFYEAYLMERLDQARKSLRR
jgi:thioredoxin-related protein